MECDRRLCCIYFMLIIVCASYALSKTRAEHQNATVLDHISVNDNNNHHLSLLKKKQNVTEREEILATYGDCSGVEILDDESQPIYLTTESFLRKCCPSGQNYEIDEFGIEKCTDENFKFNVSIINATFYENCIEDKETNVQLKFRYGYDCQPIVNGSRLAHRRSFLYGLTYGDLLYILQNGSLLRVDQNFDDYDIFDEYCLDMDRNDGNLMAKVCTLELNVPQGVLRAEAYLYSTCLWISVPCLLITAFLYLKIDEFRDLHGKSLACHAICLAIAYMLLGVAQIQMNISFMITYFIQYFLLACLCWLNVLCLDVCVKIRYAFVNKCSCSEIIESKLFVIYTIASFSLPMLPVCLSMAKTTFGIPTYYIKGHHHFDPERVNNFNFMVPAFIVLLLCSIFVLITLYVFSTKKLTNLRICENGTIQPIMNNDDYNALRQTTINVTLLFSMMSICMLIEMLASYANSMSSDEFPEISPFAFIEVFIALQGVFIFIIFVCLPKPLRVVKRWWVASGSLNVAAFTELETLKPNNNRMTQ